MPIAHVNQTRIYYESSGSGPETVVFAHGLLLNQAMFEHQSTALQDRFGCIRFDFRGQGWSEVTPGGYDMDTLAADAAALIEHLGCGPCHFVGLSMGGFVGLRLALRRPELLRSLVVIDSSADPEPEENLGHYRKLNFVARWFGLRWVVDKVMPILFGRPFLEDPSRAQERAFWRDRILGNHRIGVTRAVTGVLERRSVAEEIHRVRLPTLVLVGELDHATPLERSQRIHDRIAGSELQVVPAAGHISPVESPEAVNAALLAFYSRKK